MLHPRLQDQSLFRELAFINGQWRAATDSRTLQVRSPANGQIIGTVPLIGTDQTVHAIEAARLALPGWSAHSAKERAAVLRRWYDLMMAAQDDLAMILTAEQGKPLNEAKGEIAYGASFIEWFAEQARRDQGDVVPAAQRGKRLLALRQPVGVCAAITPWNFPNAMLTRKLGPALAAGCTMVVKPAAQTPFSALAIGVLAERAGIPAGVINIVTGRASEIADVLTASPVVRKISFTGSTEIGRRVMRACAETVKRVSLELGGNAPFIVFEDADLDAAVEGALVAKFRNNGQTCVCANRLFIQRSVLSTFAEKLTTRVKALRVGPGWEDGVQLGPLIDSSAVAKVEGHIADALAQGAQLLTGGHRLPDLGENFFAPTVLSEARQTMRVAQEETFGPVAALIPFDNEAEVLSKANDTEHGLASYVYTRDLARSWRMAEGLEYGMVGVNTGLISTAEAPFGGVKQSGQGREGSVHGMDDYTELKYVCVDIGA